MRGISITIEYLEMEMGGEGGLREAALREIVMSYLEFRARVSSAYFHPQSTPRTLSHRGCKLYLIFIQEYNVCQWYTWWYTRRT